MFKPAQLLIEREKEYYRNRYAYHFEEAEKDYQGATEDSEKDAALQNLQEWTRYIEDSQL